MSHHLTLLRHGESVANRAGVVQGQMDSPLSDLGRRQAECVAREWLSEGLRFDHVITSPLLRACETAEVIATRLGVPLELEPSWMERDFGIGQGLSIESFQDLLGPIPPLPFAPVFGDGEGAWDLYLRAARAVQAVIRRPPGRYLIVSHGALLNAALRAILGIAPTPGRAPRFTFANGGHAHLEMDDEGAWTLHALCNPLGSATDDTET
jgi:2,3-bisphosphoglycerate-dependent phosphoglycerate mutase